MSTTPIVYSSSDPSAPQLTGQTGSLVALLDALLVNGYGSGGSAKAACGWTKPSGSTSTVAAYRNSSSAGTGFHVQVVDDASGAGGAKEALLRGYEAMSNATTGTSAFPTTVQLSSGVVWHKSGTANSTTRAWWAIGCDRWLYLFVDSHGGGIAQAAPYFIGDLVSLRPGDAAMFAVSGSETTNQTTSSTRAGIGASTVVTSAVSGSSGFWLARNYAQVPGGVRCQPIKTAFSETIWGASGVPYPFEVNNGLVFERGYVAEASSRPRARLPGLYIPLHPATAMADQAVLTSVPGLPGSTSLQFKQFRTAVPSNSSNDGAALFDITNAD